MGILLCALIDHGVNACISSMLLGKIDVGFLRGKSLMAFNVSTLPEENFL
jgi:hypothetical protein